MDNFFQWWVRANNLQAIISFVYYVVKYRLDHGSGKELSLKECPREQLEKEVRILQSPSRRILNEWPVIPLLAHCVSVPL